MISIIAAAAKNGVIGSNGRIPWDIPEDRAHFRKITSGGIVIMGRRTYEEIGSPLPDRFNIVVSASRSFSGRSLRTAGSLRKALAIAAVRARKTGEQVFLCGGGKIYARGLKYASRIYLTELDDEYSGDAFFPKFSKKSFRCVSRTRSDELRLCFCVYERAMSTRAVFPE